MRPGAFTGPATAGTATSTELEVLFGADTHSGDPQETPGSAGPVDAEDEARRDLDGLFGKPDAD